MKHCGNHGVIMLIVVMVAFALVHSHNFLNFFHQFLLEYKYEQSNKCIIVIIYNNYFNIDFRLNYDTFKIIIMKTWRVIYINGMVAPYCV